MPWSTLITLVQNITHLQDGGWGFCFLHFPPLHSRHIRGCFWFPIYSFASCWGYTVEHWVEGTHRAGVNDDLRRFEFSQGDLFEFSLFPLLRVEQRPAIIKGGLKFQLLAFQGKLPHLPETKGGLLAKGYEVFRFEHLWGT